MDFPGKEKNEKILLIARKHWAMVFGHLGLSLLYFLIPIVIYFLVDYFLIAGISEFPFFPLIVLGISLYYIFWNLFFFKGLIDYYFDVWVISDSRLIDIDQKGLFEHTSAELRLDKIQDIIVEIKGFLPTMFHFGTIKVQTAAQSQSFSLEEIPDPEKVKSLITSLQSKLRVSDNL